ncbi:SDR family oxidoreductase [Aquisalimonas sp.]|uniref:SDR family oxidoreductase n=1 Tax=Aquisalimonas sp. TaxID=1872621 RepID=UPI0025B913E6|nr:SDR family oxidoreductase [Aquisalimonas sp.]
MSRAPQAEAFANRAVVVTGASSGLGASLAAALAGAGANLALSGRCEQRLEAVAARCREAGGEALVVPGDLSIPACGAELVSTAVARFGRLDMLLACAGMSMWSRFDELHDPDALRRLMDANYWALVQPSYHALPHLKKSAGILVAVSSIQGKVGVPYHTGYAASKHAVQGFCDSLRSELRASGVDVLTVLVHWIRGTRLRERALGPNGRAQGERAARHGASALSLEVATREILQAAARRKPRLYLPAKLRLLALLAELSPRLAERLITRHVERENARTS